MSNVYKRNEDGSIVSQAQGDIIFLALENEQVLSGDCLESSVIAKSESTGHVHRLRAGQQAALMAVAGVLYIKAQEAAVVEHVDSIGEPTPEHDLLTLPAGDWEIRRQTEMAPEGYRRSVLD